MNDVTGMLQAEEQPTHTVHELYQKKLFASKLKNSFLVVGVTYTISVLGAGQDWNSFLGDIGAKGSVALGIVFCLATIFSTVVHSFFTAIVGIVTIQVLNRSLQKGKLKNSLIPRLVMGFACLFFAAWFGVPILILAFWSKSLSLAWLLFHLAMTSKGNRMIGYIENGSTSFALIMISLMSAMGNWFTIVVALLAQVCLLTVVNVVASTRLYKKENGVSADNDCETQSDDRGIRLLMTGGATLLVVIHFIWLRQF